VVACGVRSVQVDTACENLPSRVRATQPPFRWLHRYSSNHPLLIRNCKFKASTAADCKSISLCTPYSVIRRTREPNYSSILNIEIAHDSLSGGTPILIDSASKIRKMGSRVIPFSSLRSCERNENKNGMSHAQRP
jgi:hypothetical protein